MVINYTVGKGLSHFKEGSAMGEVREKSSILLREVEPRYQVDEVSVAIAREGGELASLQNQLRNKMEESKARRTEEEVRDF